MDTPFLLKYWCDYDRLAAPVPTSLLVDTQKIIKTELLKLSTSIKHQNIAKALLYYIYFLLMLTDMKMQETVQSNIQ